MPPAGSRVTSGCSSCWPSGEDVRPHAQLRKADDSHRGVAIRLRAVTQLTAIVQAPAPHPALLVDLTAVGPSSRDVSRRTRDERIAGAAIIARVEADATTRTREQHDRGEPKRAHRYLASHTRSQHTLRGLRPAAIDAADEASYCALNGVS